MKAKKKAKGRHKPDWPKMFADKINDLETRVSALERSQTNPIPQPPLTEVVLSHEINVPHGDKEEAK